MVEAVSGMAATILHREMVRCKSMLCVVDIRVLQVVKWPWLDDGDTHSGNRDVGNEQFC